MNESLGAIRLFRAVNALLAEREDGGAETGAQFTGLLAEYEADAHRGARFDEIAGLVPRRGRAAWWKIERRERQYDLLRQLAARLLPNVRDYSALADAILDADEEHQTLGDRADRERRNPEAFAAPPEQDRGSIRELLFWIHKLGPMPKHRTLRRVLARGREELRFGGQTEAVDCPP